MLFFKKTKQSQTIPEGGLTPESLKGLKEKQYIEIILQLFQENKELKASVKQLEQQVAKLSKNSSNSSKPPSSDITKPPESGTSQGGKKNRKKKKRKQGAQKGHQGTSREPFAENQIDASIPCSSMESCPNCSGSVVAHPDFNPIKQQVVELLEKPIFITEYIRDAFLCQNCDQMHYAPLPEGVIEGQLLGPQLQAMVGYMKGALHCSYSGLQDFFTEVLKVPVSRGLLCQTIARISESLKVSCEALKERLPFEKLMHIDESGWKDKGRRLWAWVFANKQVSFFTIEESRGSEVLRKILGDVFNGAIISDFFSAYVKYANAMQQFCLAHLIRDIKFLITLSDPLEQQYGKKLLFQFKRMFGLWYLRDKIPKKQFREKRDKILARIRKILYKTDLPPEINRLAKRFKKHWKAIFRFLFHEGLEPTNNLAERAIRALVLDRKVTQGSRSLWGQQWNARIWTVLSTCRKQQRSAWNFIQQSINAIHSHTTYPSLVPTQA